MVIKVVIFMLCVLWSVNVVLFGLELFVKCVEMFKFV